MSDRIAGPLAEGEHVDLDTAVTVKRLTTISSSEPSDHYRVNTPDGSVELSRTEIRQLAELAGYEVRAP